VASDSLAVWGADGALVYRTRCPSVGTKPGWRKPPRPDLVWAGAPCAVFFISRTASKGTSLCMVGFHNKNPSAPGALAARSWLLTKSGPQKLSTLLE